MRFLKSLKYAFRGIVYAVNNERNLRIHTAAMLYVFAFSFFFELSRTQYAVLFLTFGSVVTAEILNTVAEELADMVAGSYHPVVRIVKDLAAGAVLVCAFFAVAVGFCLFWQPEGFRRIWEFFLGAPWRLAALGAAIALTVIYIVKGPLGIRDFIRRTKEKEI